MTVSRHAAPPRAPTLNPSMRPAVFIDLEGALLDHTELGADGTEIRFRHGAASALGALDEAGFVLVVVTNQSGLALGCFTRSHATLREAEIDRRLQLEAGVRLGPFMICPHRAGENGAPACLCRKPAPGLLVRAARAQRLDLRGSWMVGSTLDDVEAGRRAGCRAVLLDTGAERRWQHSPLRMPHRRHTEWDAVAREILGDPRHLVEHPQPSPLRPSSL
jgi:histidinol-phosphate phosphatase family protein